MRWAKPILLAMGAMVALLVTADVVFAQCAMCRTGLLNSPEGQKLANGFNKGILFLLSAPFVVVGAVAFLIFENYGGHVFRRTLGRRRPGADNWGRAQGGHHDNNL